MRMETAKALAVMPARADAAAQASPTISRQVSLVRLNESGRASARASEGDRVEKAHRSRRELGRSAAPASPRQSFSWQPVLHRRGHVLLAATAVFAAASTALAVGAAELIHREATTAAGASRDPATRMLRAILGQLGAAVRRIELTATGTGQPRAPEAEATAAKTTEIGPVALFAGVDDPIPAIEAGGFVE